MSKLDAYDVKGILKRLEGPDLPKSKLDEIGRLVDESRDGQIKVARLRAAIYSELRDDDDLASQALWKLLEKIDTAAQGLGVKIEISDKKTDGFIWFVRIEEQKNASKEIDIPRFQRSVVILMTFNPHEQDAVFKAFQPTPDYFMSPKRHCHYLGRHGNLEFIQCMSSQGVSEAQQTCNELIEDMKELADIRAIVGVGICYGINKDKQSIGDVLIAKHVFDYEMHKREANGSIEQRGGHRPSSGYLYELFRSSFSSESIGVPKCHFGTLLSGNELLNNKKRRDELADLFGDIIGGEMEGLGIYYAVKNRHIDWIIVKAVSDYGDGDKDKNKEEFQKTASKNAAQIVYRALSKGGLYNDVKQSKRVTKAVPPDGGRDIDAYTPILTELDSLKDEEKLALKWSKL